MPQRTVLSFTLALMLCLLSLLPLPTTTASAQNQKTPGQIDAEMKCAEFKMKSAAACLSTIAGAVQYARGVPLFGKAAAAAVAGLVCGYSYGYSAGQCARTFLLNEAQEQAKQAKDPNYTPVPYNPNKTRDIPGTTTTTTTVKSPDTLTEAQKQLIAKQQQEEAERVRKAQEQRDKEDAKQLRDNQAALEKAIEQATRVGVATFNDGVMNPHVVNVGMCAMPVDGAPACTPCKGVAGHCIAYFSTGGGPRVAGVVDMRVAQAAASWSEWSPAAASIQGPTGVVLFTDGQTVLDVACTAGTVAVVGMCQLTEVNAQGQRTNLGALNVVAAKQLFNFSWQPGKLVVSSDSLQVAPR